MGSLFLPAAQNDQELQADLQSQLSPSVGAVYDRLYNFDVLEGFTGALVKQSALSGAGESGEKLSVDQLRKEYTDGLVNFDRPVTRAQAELIRDRKREEIQRQDTWQRAEGWATTSGVTASLAAGVVDPIGMAVGVVVAPAKGIQMLGGLRAMAASSSLASRALGTAGLTAVDAAIGNAVLEPYNLYSHQQYYADYTMADSLANVVFGGILGGTVGGGAVVIGRGLSHVGKWTPEWLRGKQEATHETSLHTAVAQVLDGRPVQVEPVLRSDPNLRVAEGHPVQATEMAGPRVDEPTPHVQDSARPADDILLPKDLSGAKPRYSYGAGRNGFELFGLEFASDLDKAAYVIGAAKQLSKRDADYLDFVMQHTGYTAEQARAYGREIRAQIKSQAKESFGQDLGTLKVEPSVHAVSAREAGLQSPEVPTLRDVLTPEATGRAAPGVQPDSMEFRAASGKEVLDQAKQHMESPRTGAADDVAEDFEAEILATHKDTAEYYEPATKTRKMMELEKEIDYQQGRLTQEHGEVAVDGLKQADDALTKADDLRAAMVEGLACLLRK